MMYFVSYLGEGKNGMVYSNMTTTQKLKSISDINEIQDWIKEKHNLKNAVVIGVCKL